MVSWHLTGTALTLRGLTSCLSFLWRFVAPLVPERCGSGGASGPLLVGGDVPAVETFSTPPGGGAVSPGWASTGGADSAAGAWAAPGWSASWVGSWFSGFGRTLILKRCLRKFRIVTDRRKCNLRVQFLLLFACLFVFAVGCAPNWKDASSSAVSATGIYARNEKESDF